MKNNIPKTTRHKRHPQLGYRKLYKDTFGTPKNKLGAIVIFKYGVTENEAINAFKQIQHLLEKTPQLNKFDQAKGSHVFYIP